MEIVFGLTSPKTIAPDKFIVFAAPCLPEFFIVPRIAKFCFEFHFHEFSKHLGELADPGLYM